MVEFDSINNDAEMAAAMARVEELFRSNPNILDAGPGNLEYDELRALTDLVLEYDDIHYPIEPPTLAQTIEVRMEDAGITPEGLVPCIGSREAVDEVLAGQREVTSEMAEALYEHLNIDVRDLLGQDSATAGG